METEREIEPGPQNPKDSPFLARMRRQQSWYRARVLQVAFGTGPRSTNQTPFGSMLTRADGERGLNFLTPHIFTIARRRSASRKGLIDEFRLYCDMLSSLAAAFNLFAPLVDQRDLATRLVAALLPAPVARVSAVTLAYLPSPSKEYLNDATGYDALVEYELAEGELGFAGFVLKLAEPLAQKAVVSPAAQTWLKRDDAPFVGLSGQEIMQPEVNALWRAHLLAEALLHHPRSKYVTGQVIFLHHPQDPAARSLLETYRSLLRHDQRTFVAMSLDEVAAKWQDQPWIEKFRERYLKLEPAAGDEP